MEFRLTAEDRLFQGQARELFRENPPPHGPPLSAENKRYRRLLADQGWLTLHWPVAYGGRGANQMQQVLFKEEAFRVGAEVSSAGVAMVGPTLMLHGSDEQKRRFLGPIARDEIVFCQGFSEPGAGSDLASLQTRAVRDGDDYVINGHKIWTSGAHLADWMFMLARTDPQAPKHRGISFFLLDVKTAGVQIVPLIQMTGVHGFNEVFFDGVRMPAMNRVGEENLGWHVATTTLDFERSGIERVQTADRDLVALERWWRANQASRAGEVSESQRLRIADLRVAVEVARILAYRVAWMQSRGLVPTAEASISKAFASDVGQAVARAAINIVGLVGQLTDESPYAAAGISPGFRYLDSVRLTIGQGTGEIQRNVIATRGLGLGRD